MFDYTSWFENLSPELATFLMAMLPIAELRAAIPVALGLYKTSIASAYFWSVIGNLTPVVFILWLLEPVSRWLTRHSRLMEKFFIWLFERTRQKHTKRFEYWGAFALVTFVAIPLPFTGAWTGALAAFVFGVRYWKALGLIALGVLIAGVVVSLTSLGAFSIF